jgi:putative transposase
MKQYPGKLYHCIPSWVSSGAVFHIRVRAHEDQPVPLTNSSIAPHMLHSAFRYEEMKKWYVHLFLVMPDHVHALLSFPQEPGMAKTIGLWKRFLKVSSGIQWQENFFDHRIRNNEEFDEKAAYIRRNPVVKGLCRNEVDWPWSRDRHNIG